jgi:pyridoxal phosphate enzyme (YggS family)
LARRLISGLDAGRVAENAARVREDIAVAATLAGREPRAVELLAAVKYVALDELEVLASAGLRLLGENRAQDLAAKAAAHPGVFRWHFIGQLQSRRVPELVPHVELIHSLASDSAAARLGRQAAEVPEVLVEVNVAGERSKAGIAPSELAGFIARCPVPVTGLMTMPPPARDPEASRPYFSALRELAAEHGLHRLSMGTSQDYAVAVEEGATIVRVGSVLFE